jgi:DNA-binding response OmpR family regulator
MTLQPFSFPNLLTDRPRRRTILLVEDEPFVREATASILKSAGYEVFPASDVRDAIDVFEARTEKIDLLLTDMMLPGGTGQQLGEDLRLRSPEIVILVTSGYSDLQEEIESSAARRYFLAKPYSRRTLVDKIETILPVLPLARPATQVG